MATQPQRWIMHVDMDAFFAAIEQRDRPELRDRPVVVGAQPGGRGVVATCSYEARKFGIRSAMPINEAHRRCSDAVYLRPDMARYAAASRSVMQALTAISPLVEPVSIDEAYVDVSGLEQLLGEPWQIASAAKERIFQAVGLTSSVGIGPNRLIAKLASDYRKPDGITIVAPEQVDGFLAPMPVERLRGIGQRTAERIQRLGLRTVADLRRCPLELLAAHFGSKGAELLYNQSRGIGSDQVGAHGPRKSISREITFAEDVADRGVLEGVLRDLAADVGRQCRAEKLRGRVVTLKIRFTGYETHTRQRTLEHPTNHDRVIYQTAQALAAERAFSHKAVRLIGVGLCGWEGGAPQQLELFQSEQDPARERQLYSTLDAVRERFGSESLRLGVGNRKPRH